MNAPRDDSVPPKSLLRGTSSYADLARRLAAEQARRRRKVGDDHRIEIPRVFPWLVKSEVMHFTYAVVMLVGLVLLRPGFRGAARGWWTASLAIQTWHLVEHTTLQLQALAGQNLFGSPVPTSFLQVFVPRPELHLLYNLAVFVPMIVAMWLHTRPDQADVNQCTCATAPIRMEQAGLTGV
jgi:hypothetical protein